MDGHYVPSLLAAIGEVIEQHLVNIGFMPGDGEREEAKAEVRATAGADGGAGGGSDTRLRRCSRCSQPALIRIEGCDTCTSCGYSKCS